MHLRKNSLPDLLPASILSWLGSNDALPFILSPMLFRALSKSVIVKGSQGLGVRKYEGESREICRAGVRKCAGQESGTIKAGVGNHGSS